MIDMKGKRCGLVTVVRRSPLKRWRDTLWECVCECGEHVVLPGNSLRREPPKTHLGCKRARQQREAAAQ
jgi:hypothetical protein